MLEVLVIQSLPSLKFKGFLYTQHNILNFHITQHLLPISNMDLHIRFRLFNKLNYKVASLASSEEKYTMIFYTVTCASLLARSQYRRMRRRANQPRTYFWARTTCQPILSITRFSFSGCQYLRNTWIKRYKMCHVMCWGWFYKLHSPVSYSKYDFCLKFQ